MLRWNWSGFCLHCGTNPRIWSLNGWKSEQCKTCQQSAQANSNSKWQWHQNHMLCWTGESCKTKPLAREVEVYRTTHLIEDLNGSWSATKCLLGQEKWNIHNPIKEDPKALSCHVTEFFCSVHHIFLLYFAKHKFISNRKHWYCKIMETVPFAFIPYLFSCICENCTCYNPKKQKTKAWSWCSNRHMQVLPLLTLALRIRWAFLFVRIIPVAFTLLSILDATLKFSLNIWVIVILEKKVLGVKPKSSFDACLSRKHVQMSNKKMNLI